MSSLRGVVVKMHLSYLMALLFICLALTVSFVVSFTVPLLSSPHPLPPYFIFFHSFKITNEFVGNLQDIANDIKVSDLRIQNVYLWVLTVTIMPITVSPSIPSYLSILTVSSFFHLLFSFFSSLPSFLLPTTDSGSSARSAWF